MSKGFGESFLNFPVNDTNTNKMRPERKKKGSLCGRKRTDVGHLDMQSYTTIPALHYNCFLPFIKPRTHQSVYLNSLLRSLENPVKAFCFRRGKEEKWSAELLP